MTVIDVETLERDARWRGLPEKASERLELLGAERQSGVRAVELNFGSKQQGHSDRKLDTAPEIFAFIVGAILSSVVGVAALAVGETGSALIMLAPLVTALLGLAFIGVTALLGR